MDAGGEKGDNGGHLVTGGLVPRSVGRLLRACAANSPAAELVCDVLAWIVVVVDDVDVADAACRGYSKE